MDSENELFNRLPIKLCKSFVLPGTEIGFYASLICCVCFGELCLQYLTSLISCELYLHCFLLPQLRFSFAVFAVCFLYYLLSFCINLGFQQQMPPIGMLLN